MPQVEEEAASTEGVYVSDNFDTGTVPVLE